MRLRPNTLVPALAAAAVCCLAVAGLRAQEGKKAHAEQKAHAKGAMAGGITRAIAVLHPTKSGGEAHGTVTFTRTDKGIEVAAEVRGLTPGEHGFHIHEFGDCSSPDAMSAGGHFNPMKMEHGGPMETKRHVGDLGNITADANGVARLRVVDPSLSFHGATSILGRGLIVHEKADDLKSQPSGAAGGRVACGVIGVAKGQ